MPPLDHSHSIYILLALSAAFSVVFFFFNLFFFPICFKSYLLSLCSKVGTITNFILTVINYE